MLSTIPLRLLISALALVFAAAPAAAEDGHDLWLRYRPIEQPTRDAYARRATARRGDVREPDDADRGGRTSPRN